MARLRDKVIDTQWPLFLPLKQAQLPSPSQVPPPLPPLEHSLCPFLLLSVVPGCPALPTAWYCPSSVLTFVLSLCSEQTSYRTWDPGGPWAHLTLVLV